MEITFLGYVSLVITLILLFFRKVDYLLYAALFFSGFTGSSVVNLFEMPLPPFYYFFAAYIVFSLLYKKNLQFKWRLDFTLSVFILYCLVSQFFPFVYKNCGIIIMNQAGVYSALSFSSSNLKQIAYLLYCVIFFNALLKFRNNEYVRGKMISAFRAGVWAVVLVCLYQLIAFRFDLEFDFFFRQNVNGNVQGTRIYGPCIEASMLCYYLIPAMLLVWQNRRRGVDGIFDYILILVVCILGIISRSSTFLIGMVILFVAFIVWLFMSENRKNIAKYKIPFAVCAGFVLIGVFILHNSVMTMVREFIDKLQLANESGQERYSAFVHMLSIGLRYPTGVGFGCARSKDLFSTWMCNVGIVGMAIYFLYLARFTLRVYKRSGVGYALPYLVVVVLMLVSVPEPYGFFIWFCIYYAESAPNRKKQKEEWICVNKPLDA